MSNDTKFDRQLKELLEIENLPDEVSNGDSEHEDIHDLAPVEFETKESKRKIAQEDLKSDYDFARSNYYGLIGRSNAAIDMVLKIAQMSEHPRAIEVASNLMKTSSDITKELIKLQESLDKLEKQNDSSSKDGKYVQNNNYYTIPNEKDDVMSKLNDLSDKPNDNDDTK